MDTEVPRIPFFLYELHELHEWCLCTESTELTDALYTESFLTNTEGHGGSTDSFLSVRITRITRMLLLHGFVSTRKVFYTDSFNEHGKARRDTDVL